MKLCCIKCGSYEINHSASDGCDSQLKYLCGVCHWKTLAEIRLAYVGQLERNVNELKDQIMNNQLCDTNLKVSQERDDLHVRVKRLEEAGDLLSRMVFRQDGYGIYQDEEDAVNGWNKAKEAKL